MFGVILDLTISCTALLEIHIPSCSCLVLGSLYHNMAVPMELAAMITAASVPRVDSASTVPKPLGQLYGQSSILISNRFYVDPIAVLI